MALWKKTDQSNNSPMFGPSTVKLTSNVANRDSLFGNTTADAFITGQTIGVFGVDANESKALSGKVAHTGWVKRTVGSGGRAGRIQYEVLVAGGISSDAEDTVFADYVISIITQPLANTANTGDPATFRVVATSTPSTTLSYQWQYSNGTNVTANSIYTGSTTANLVISDTTGLDATVYKVVVSATGANSVTSTNATLTVV